MTPSEPPPPIAPPVRPPAPYGSAGYYRPGPMGPVCPRCGAPGARKVSYTWWGGIVGPRMFDLVRCDACRYQFNGTTGADVRKPIAIYLAVTLGLTAAVILSILYSALVSHP